MATPPYVTPPTAVAGAPLPAADWNAKVRDSVESIAKPVRCAVSRITDVLIAHNTLSPVPWVVENYDSDGLWAVSPNPDRITIPAGLGGLYLVTFNATFDLNATGGRYITIYKNGAPYLNPVNTPASVAWYPGPQIVLPVPLAPGEYVQGVVYQSSGGNLNMKASVYSMAMTVTRIGII